MKRLLTILTLSAVLLALSSGAPEFECKTCHVNAGKANFEILGLPLTYSPGGVYKITVAITEGPVSKGPWKGGIAVIADKGKLIPLDDKTQLVRDVRTGELMLTHTLKGAKCRKWTFEWIAPKKPEKVTFKIAVIAANGDGSPFGDAYAAKEITLTPAAATTTTTTAMAAGPTVTKTVTVTQTVTLYIIIVTTTVTGSS